MIDASAGSHTRLAAAAAALLAAHRGPKPLILPNAWDVASARIIEEAGFPVIATSSRAVAAVLGQHDDDSSDPDVVFPFLARISAAVRSPVTADLEGGYRLAPDTLVARMLSAGIVGCNLEDSDHHGSGVLIDAERQAEYLAAVRAAAEAEGIHIVINARVDTFIRKVGDERAQLDEAIRRGARYLAAGADCVYPITLTDRRAIEDVVTRLPGPVNVMARPEGPPIDELAGLGVRRISFGSGLHSVAMEALRSTLEGLRQNAPR